MTDKAKDSSKKDNEGTGSITFHYIKNSGFRQIHVDGCYGNLTPQGFINVNFYSERWPIPKSSEHIFENGELSPEEARVSDDSLIGVVREIEIGGYLSIKAAIALKDFLNERILEYNDVFENIQSSKNE